MDLYRALGLEDDLSLGKTARDPGAGHSSSSRQFGGFYRPLASTFGMLRLNAVPLPCLRHSIYTVLDLGPVGLGDLRHPDVETPLGAPGTLSPDPRAHLHRLLPPGGVMSTRHPPGAGSVPEVPADPLLVGKLLRIAEVADRLGLSTRSVQSLVAAGKLRIVRLSPRAVRVSQGDVDEFIRRAAGPAPTT